MFSLGCYVIFGVITVVNIRAAVEMRRHHWSYDAILAFEFLLLVPTAYASSSLDSNGSRGDAGAVFGRPLVWILWPLLVVTTLLPFAAWAAWRNLFQPSLSVDVLRMLAGRRVQHHEAEVREIVRRHNGPPPTPTDTPFFPPGTAAAARAEHGGVDAHEPAEGGDGEVEPPRPGGEGEVPGTAPGVSVLPVGEPVGM